MFGRAMPLDRSSNAILSYAQTVSQFPLGVFGIAVATAVFPLLSRSAGHAEEFTGHLRRGLRLSAFIALPACVGMAMVSTDLIRVIYGGLGNARATGSSGFSPDGLSRCTLVLMCFSPTILASSINHVLTRAYYAMGDTRTPMRVALACVSANALLNLTLIWPLREAGMALSTSITAASQCALLLALAPRSLRAAPIDRVVIQAWLRMALCSFLMALALSAVARLMTSNGSWQFSALRLTTSVVLGAGAYAAFSLLLRAPEAKWLLQRAPRGVGQEMPLE
jgi:putative peptidoglycan lipid II flippase